VNKRKKTIDSSTFKIPFNWIVWLIPISLLIYGIIRMEHSQKPIIPISIIALISGIIYESKRISKNWAIVFYFILGSCGFSFFTFMPGKNEYIYNFESHLEIGTYAFILTFIIINISFNGEKVIPKLTEGITLLQSISVIYWVIDNGFISINNIFLKSILLIGLLFSLFSGIHAFTHTNLSKTNRLILSIWSSIIMLFFAVDNIFRVYLNESIENVSNSYLGIYIGLQYFLLGISSLYIAQNFFMLFGFFPRRGAFFNSQYFRELRDLKSDHIERYSDLQVSISHSLICLTFSSSIFIINYIFQIIPGNMAIWSVFFATPFTIKLIDNIKKNYS
jgi:hypothetical protein